MDLRNVVVGCVYAFVWWRGEERGRSFDIDESIEIRDMNCSDRNTVVVGMDSFDVDVGKGNGNDA